MSKAIQMKHFSIPLALAFLAMVTFSSSAMAGVRADRDHTRVDRPPVVETIQIQTGGFMDWIVGWLDAHFGGN